MLFSKSRDSSRLWFNMGSWELFRFVVNMMIVEEQYQIVNMNPSAIKKDFFKNFWTFLIYVVEASMVKYCIKKPQLTIETFYDVHKIEKNENNDFVLFAGTEINRFYIFLGILDRRISINLILMRLVWNHVSLDSYNSEYTYTYMWIIWNINKIKSNQIKMQIQLIGWKFWKIKILKIVKRIWISHMSHILHVLVVTVVKYVEFDHQLAMDAFEGWNFCIFVFRLLLFMTISLCSVQFRTSFDWRFKHF